MSNTSRCKNCDEPLQGQYCHKCGEKKLSLRDRSVTHWFQDTLSQFIQLDGKLIRTVTSMVARPGTLARNYYEGVRVPYLKFVNLFLIANLLYFLTPGIQTFKSSLRIQAYQQLYSPYVLDIIDHYQETNEASFEELEVVYNSKTAEVSKLIMILLVLLLGVVIYAFFYKQMFLTDAFNLALQFWSAYIILFILPFSAVIIINQNIVSLGRVGEVIFSEWVLSSATLLFSGLYLWQILRRFSQKWWHHLIRLTLITASFVIIFTVYRAVLFLATMMAV